MKVWDLRNEAQPLNVIRFHDHLLGRLCDLYDCDAIYDKFELAWNKNGSQLMTGSYSNTFYVCDAFGETRQMLRAKNGQPARGAGFGKGDNLNANQKVQHVAYHPRAELLALGAKDFGYLYHKHPF